MKSLLAEFAGTFALVLVGTGSIVLDEERMLALGALGIGLAFGGIVCLLILLLGRSSGAHLNPAVTAGFALAGLFPLARVPQYLIAQFSGAVAASLVLAFAFPSHPKLGASLPSGFVSDAFAMELLLTAILMGIILTFSQGPAILQSFTAVAVGLTVFLEAWLAGPFCGASMNPARSLAPAVVSGATQHLWVYVTATTAGALLIALLWRLAGYKK